MQKLLEGELPTLGELQALLDRTLPEPVPPQNTSSVEPYRRIVEKLVKADVEIAVIRERLKERGYGGSYAAVYRFVRHIKPIDRLRSARAAGRYPAKRPRPDKPGPPRRPCASPTSCARR